MLNIIKNFFSNNSNLEDDQSIQLVEHAIDLTVDGTDPRLHQLSGYRKKLRHSVKIAMQFVNEIVEEMHPPLEISRNHYVADPQVRAFFGSASDIDGLFKNSRELNEYLYHTVTNDEFIYLGMAMNLSIKNVLARKVVNGILKTDVKRTAVNFSDNRLVDPSESEASLREKIKERVFMALVQSSLMKLISVKDQKHELEEQRSLLNAKLRNYKKQALGIEPRMDSSEDNSISIETLRTELAEIENSLKHLSTNILTLDEYLEIINNVMENASSYIKAENSSIRVTKMNFAATENDDEPSEDIFYTNFETIERKVAGRLIKVARNEIKQSN